MSGPDSDDGKARTEEATSEAKRHRKKKHLDEKLDEALEETFPASDAFVISPEEE